MKKLLLPLILLVVGVGSGVGAGLVLKPAPIADDLDHGNPCGEVAEADEHVAEVAPIVDAATEREYAKMNNQFVIPVVQDGKVAALVVMALNLEVTNGSRENIFIIEPKLRDAFLQVMFDHANIGGFSGNFTSGTNMRALRSELLRAAQNVAGTRITDVLIIDIVRQDS